MMSLMKLSRITTGQPKPDNWVDLAGYAACGGEVDNELDIYQNTNESPTCGEDHCEIK
jgi:hypothetical protein